MHKIFFSAFFATKFTYEKFKILSAVFTFHIHDIVPPISKPIPPIANKSKINIKNQLKVTYLCGLSDQSQTVNLYPLTRNV